MSISHTDVFKGFEVTLSKYQMKLKMYLYTWAMIFLLQCLVSFLISLVTFSGAWKLLIEYIMPSLTSFSLPNFQTLFELIGKLIKASMHIFIFTLPLWLLYPLLMKRFAKKAKEITEESYVAGSKIGNEKEVIDILKKEPSRLSIGNIPLPIREEAKHIFIIGKSGSGKTVLLSNIIEHLRQHNLKTVIYDSKGLYISRFYDPGKDLIFNPLDARGVDWNLFSEIETPMDITSIAASLIPVSADWNDPYWPNAARDLFSGILHHLYEKDEKNNSAIWQTVTTEIPALAELMKSSRGGRIAYSHIQDCSKQASSVVSVMSLHCACFQFMLQGRSDFSIKKWLTADNGGFIFVSNYSEIEDTLKPVISLFIDQFARRTLSMPDDFNRRIFLVLDEFGTLQKLSSIQNFLTQGRSKGGSCVFAVQDVGQIEKIYSKEIRQAIVNAASTNVICGVADPDTAEYLARKIGKTRVIKAEESFGMGPEDMRDGININRRETEKDLFMPSDLMNLPDLTALIKISHHPLVMSKYDYKEYPFSQQSMFLLREGLSMGDIYNSYRQNLEAVQTLFAR